MLDTIFTVLFGVGMGYALIGFVFGEIIGHGDTDVTSLSPLKPSVIASFIIVFGGTGLIFMRVFIPITAIPLAGLTATAVAFVFYRFIMVPLSKAQNTTAIEQKSLIGKSASVSEKIPQGGYGKIKYVVNESTYTAPAKSDSGDEIARNASVEIISIEKNTFFVRPV